MCGVPAYADPAGWGARAPRVENATDRVLSLLSESGSTATFFVLGWIGRTYPGLVRRIVREGHEIASHGDLHGRVLEQSLPAFREDVRRARGTLQDLSGCDVTAFRAPEWSMRNPSNPAFAVLVEEGYRIDSSLAAAPPVGDATNPVRPCRIKTAAGPINEVPVLTGSFFARKAILGGGVCSRMSRFERVISIVDASLAAGTPPVLYLHPWELDPAHPAMDLPFLSRLVHFAGRRRTAPRLRRLLARYRFGPVSSAVAEEGKSSLVSARSDAA